MRTSPLTLHTTTTRALAAPLRGGGGRPAGCHMRNARVERTLRVPQTPAATGRGRAVAGSRGERLAHAHRRLERLRVAEARVAESVVLAGEVILREAASAADALGDAALARELDVDAAEDRSALLVALERLANLGHDVVEVAILVAALGALGVAVHAVDLPHDRHARRLHGLDVAGKEEWEAPEGGKP